MAIDTTFLRACALEQGIELDDSNLSAMTRFYDMVVDSNKAFNLTAITDERDFVIKHYIDSLAGISEIASGASLCDIGAGAGFPSIPIAIARPDVTVTAIDSTAKKTVFINQSAATLGLANIHAIAGRAEEQRSIFASFDAVCARAVSALPILLELALPMLKVGGKFIAYKTDESELCAAKSALTTLGGKLINTKSFTLPDGERRAILVFEKTRSTPPQYPRQYGAIKKRPL